LPSVLDVGFLRLNAVKKLIVLIKDLEGVIVSSQMLDKTVVDISAFRTDYLIRPELDHGQALITCNVIAAECKRPVVVVVEIGQTESTLLVRHFPFGHF
jgi:hypothetical protein